VSFAAITLCVASQRVIIVLIVYFVIDSVRKLLDTPSYDIFSIWRNISKYTDPGRYTHYVATYWLQKIGGNHITQRQENNIKMDFTAQDSNDEMDSNDL
jgi:hypothetical protein